MEYFLVRGVDMFLQVDSTVPASLCLNQTGYEEHMKEVHWWSESALRQVLENNLLPPQVAT